jgi:hypothetical protein
MKGNMPIHDLFAAFGILFRLVFVAADVSGISKLNQTYP